MVNKKLEVEACRVFVCPNLALIDQKGKELGLRDDVMKRAKNIAIEYFKKTYHEPRYASARYLMPSFIYIASILECTDGKDRKTQNEVSDVFGIGLPTIRKWNEHIVDILKIEIIF